MCFLARILRKILNRYVQVKTVCEETLCTRSYEYFVFVRGKNTDVLGLFG